MSAQISFLEPSVENGTEAQYRRRSVPSRIAAEHVNRTLPERQARVLKVIRLGGKSGATIHEIAVTLRLPDNSVSGRVRELALRGVIYDTGKRRENPGTGCTATVWRCV